MPFCCEVGITPCECGHFVCLYGNSPLL